MKKIFAVFIISIFVSLSSLFAQNAAPNDERNIDREFYMLKNFSSKKNIILQEKLFFYI